MEWRLTEIDKEFYSFATGKPFDHCIECDKHLLSPDCEYFIEKAVKKYEGFSAKDVIFEYAICIDCAERLRQELSKESMATIQQFFMQRVNMMDRVLASQHSEADQLTSSCLVSHATITEVNEYQLFAQCRGNSMVIGPMPYMISGSVLEELSELLSKETRDELDNFSKRHFGPPPELAQPLPYERVLII